MNFISNAIYIVLTDCEREYSLLRLFQKRSVCKLEMYTSNIHIENKKRAVSLN